MSLKRVRNGKEEKIRKNRSWEPEINRLTGLRWGQRWIAGRWDVQWNRIFLFWWNFMSRTERKVAQNIKFKEQEECLWTHSCHVLLKTYFAWAKSHLEHYCLSDGNTLCPEHPCVLDTPAVHKTQESVLTKEDFRKSENIAWELGSYPGSG